MTSDRRTLARAADPAVASSSESRPRRSGASSAGCGARPRSRTSATASSSPRVRCSSRPSPSSRSRSRWRSSSSSCRGSSSASRPGPSIDRVDRRRLVVLVNLLRAVVLVVLAASVATGTAGLPIVLRRGLPHRHGRDVQRQRRRRAPRDVRPEGSARGRERPADRRLASSPNQLVGPPIGALLFTLGDGDPVRRRCHLRPAGRGADRSYRARRPTTRAVAEDAASRHVASPRRRPTDLPPGDGRRDALAVAPPAAADAGPDDLLLQRDVPRCDGRCSSLYATERLGLDDVGFGLLLTAGASVGSSGRRRYGRLERRFSLATIMRGGLIVETLTHLVLAVDDSALVAGAMMTALRDPRRRLGDDRDDRPPARGARGLLGRVTSVYMLGCRRRWPRSARCWAASSPSASGSLAPFWFGFVGSSCCSSPSGARSAAIAHAPTAAAEPSVVARSTCMRHSRHDGR